MERPDYIVDIQGLSPGTATPADGSPTGESPTGHPPAQGGASLRGRPWIAIKWKCCHVYSRVYRNSEGNLYEGRCPRCSRAVRIRVGPGGVNARFFEAQ